MIDFLSRFFRREEASKTLAKERLRFILMSDRVSLAPDIFDAMKGEMLEVLRRYLEIDERGMDVHFENAERQFALLATIPVREVRTHDAIALARTASYSSPLQETAGHSSPPQETADTSLLDETPDATETAAVTEQLRPPQRRRRRRKSRSAVPAVPQPEMPPDQIEGPQPRPG